jgi:RND family efflux transporter MFP subunit
MNLLRKGALGVAGIVLLGLGTAGMGWLQRPTQSERPVNAPAPATVTVAHVEQRDVPHLARGFGNVQSLNSVTLRSQIDGILTEILFQEGQHVAEGTLLAKIDDRAILATLAQARADKARNEAQRHSAVLDLKRYNDLFAKDKAIPRQTVDQTAALVEELEAAIASNDATIAAAEVQLSYTRIVSPLDGRVGLRRVDPGNLIRTADATGLVTVTQLDPIAVVFSLPQDMLPRIQTLLHGAEPVTVTALDRDGGEVLATGRLAFIDNQIDSATGTIRLKAEFANAEERLWPGQFVTVELPIGISPSAMVVVAKAVQLGVDGSFVYRVVGDKVEAVPVSIEYQNDDLAVIESGLAIGDTVVVDGHSRLKPGASIRIAGGTPSDRLVDGKTP